MSSVSAPARFVYIGSDDGPAKTSMKYIARRGTPGDMKLQGTYEFIKGGDSVMVPPRMAERLRLNPYFAEDGTDAARAAHLRREAIKAADEAAERARKQTESEILSRGKPKPEAKPKAAAAPAPKVEAEGNSNAGANQDRAAKQGPQAPRSAGGGGKPLSQ